MPMKNLASSCGTSTDSGVIHEGEVHERTIIIDMKEAQVISGVIYEHILSLKGGKEELIRQATLYTLLVSECKKGLFITWRVDKEGKLESL